MFVSTYLRPDDHERADPTGVIISCHRKTTLNVSIQVRSSECETGSPMMQKHLNRSHIVNHHATLYAFTTMMVTTLGFHSCFPSRQQSHFGKFINKKIRR